MRYNIRQHFRQQEIKRPLQIIDLQGPAFGGCGATRTTEIQYDRVEISL